MLTGCKELKLHVSRANGFIRDMLIIFIFTEINTKNRPSRFKGKKQIQKKPPLPSPLLCRVKWQRKTCWRKRPEKFLTHLSQETKRFLSALCCSPVISCEQPRVYLSACFCLFKKNKQTNKAQKERKNWVRENERKISRSPIQNTSKTHFWFSVLETSLYCYGP